MTKAADRLSEKKRGEKDAKLAGVAAIYDSSHNVLDAFN
jgi:hypothetical protein